LVIGLLGLSLPALLVLQWRGKSGSVLDSLSAYYYSDVRDQFVGALCAVSLFLITYMVFEKNLDNFLSLAAGAGALIVALVPTGAPDGSTRASALPVWVHFAAATVFICSLGGICYLFGYREGHRTNREDGGRKTFWMWLHYFCAGLIAAAVLFIALTVRSYGYSLLVGESGAVLAFAVSWIAKGSELAKTFGQSSN
jgi:hypothetical protein